MSRGANVLDGLEYYPEFYAHDEQLELLRFLQAQRELGSDLFGSSYAVLKNGREVIQYGVHFDFAKRKITSQRVAPVPALVVRFFARLRALGVGGLEHEFNSAIINFYYSPGAHISPHVDSLEYTTGHAVLSLQGPANIQFGSLSRARGARPIPPSSTGVYDAPFELRLVPGSLLFVAGAAATQAVHSVSVLPAGGMRVSVTGRVVPQARLDQLGIRLDVMRTLSRLDATLAHRASASSPAGGGDPGAGSAIEHSGSVSENLHHQPPTTSIQPATASLSESVNGRGSSGRGNSAGMPYHKGKGKGKGKGGGRGGVLAQLMQTGSDSAGAKGDSAEIDSEKQSRTTVSSSRPSLKPPVAALSSSSEELAIAPTPQPPAPASEPSAPTAATATPVSHVALPPSAASPLPPSAVSPTEQAKAPATESTDESADKATAPSSTKLRRSTRVIPPPKPIVTEPVVTTTGKGQRAAKPAKAPTELKRVSDYDTALESHLKVQARKEAGQARLVSSTPTMLRTPMPNDYATQANHSDAQDTAGASPSDAAPPPAHGEVATRVDGAPPALGHELLEARADALWEEEMKDEQFQRELLQAKKASRADADVEMERAVEASLEHSEAVQRRFHVAQAELHGALHASRASHYAQQAAALHALVDGVRSGEACGGAADSVAGARLAASLPATTPLADESVPVRQSRLPAPGRLSDAPSACRPNETPYDRSTEYKAIAEIVVDEVIAAVALQLALDESVAAALDSGEQSKQQLGELLFLQLSALRPNLPAEEGTDKPTLGKVVGMLLEEDDNAIVQSIKDPAVLERRTAEAVSVFGQWWAETIATTQVHALANSEAREDNSRVDKARGNVSWADLVEEDESAGTASEKSCATCGVRKSHMPYCTQTQTYRCNEPWEGRELTCVVAHLMETGTRRVSLPWLNEEHDLRELKCLVTNNANVFSLCIARTDTKTAVVLDKSCATLLPGMAWSPVVEQSKATESYAALSTRSLYEPGDAGQPAGASTTLSSRRRRRAQLQSKAPGQSSFRSAAEYCQRFRSLVALEAAHELKQLKLRSMDAVDVTWESGPQQERVACFKWLGRDLVPGEQLIVQHPGKALDLRVWCGDVTADPTNPNVFSTRAVVIATDSTLKGTEMPTHDFNISKAVNTVQFPHSVGA